MIVLLLFFLLFFLSPLIVSTPSASFSSTLFASIPGRCNFEFQSADEFKEKASSVLHEWSQRLAGWPCAGPLTRIADRGSPSARNGERDFHGEAGTKAATYSLKDLGDTASKTPMSVQDLGETATKTAMKNMKDLSEAAAKTTKEGMKDLGETAEAA